MRIQRELCVFCELEPAGFSHYGDACCSECYASLNHKNAYKTDKLGNPLYSKPVHPAFWMVPGDNVTYFPKPNIEPALVKMRCRCGRKWLKSHPKALESIRNHDCSRERNQGNGARRERESRFEGCIPNSSKGVNDNA